MRRLSVHGLLASCAILLGWQAIAPAADLKLSLPQARTAFGDNEWIDLAVVRSDAQSLPAAPLALSVTGEDGSKVTATFALDAVPATAGAARGTEHLHLNGALLRPGKYLVEVAVHGAAAKTPIEVCSHIRRSDYRLINWGRATGAAQLSQGEDSLGYNTFYGGYGNDDEANFIRAGVDYIANCVMSGGHQMDLRSECDWSDPYVTRGGTMRVVRRAMVDRNRPNVPGVHFYDEPGLTWEKHPVTGVFGPHGVAAQVRAYTAAFGRAPISYHEVDPKNPEHVALWKQWATWKLGFMDAAWKEAQFGISYVRPDFLSLTQSQYGFSAFTDGYYFNVVRSLPITSGHGGYHDWGPGYFNPSYTLEIARARDFWKPCWYLPTWYGNTTSDQFRAEQYLSFQTNLQGMMSPPDMEPATNATGRQGIVETNQLFQKLGPVFNTMPVSRPPVCMLYSLSQAIHTQTKDMTANYAHAMPQGITLPLTYLSGKLIQQQFLPVVEEDILDGTVANDHRAIVLSSIDYLDPAVVAALENFAAGGGLVLLTGDSTVAIKGAIKLAVKPQMPDQALIDQLAKDKKYPEMAPYVTTAKFLEGATPLATSIKAELDKAGIHAPLVSDVPTIVATRQAAGDVEYLLAVNASPDTAKKGGLELKATAATLSLVGDGRPVYDAVVGGPVAELKPQGDRLSGTFRFGPGQMRVFARTARPIGGVRVSAPTITRELAVDKQPIRMDLSAVVLDGAGGILSGSIPLQVRVIDPLGSTRYELFRATKAGSLNLTLPLAANDPSGKWTIVVRELLGGTQDKREFAYAAPARARSLAGATQRAVHVAQDRDNAFRFARLHHEVTIVKGSSSFNAAAAERLAATLKPWGVTCKEVDLATAAKSRTLTPEEARTWVGLQFAGSGQVKAGADNAPAIAGFNVQGPVILLGNAEDNPIIKFLQTEKFLPYTPDAVQFPGAGRGMYAWQRDGIGRGQESITLIAYDERGMQEAVGSLYEAFIGMEPLTRFAWPQSDTITPAQSAPRLTPEAQIAWSVNLPDRVRAIKIDGGNLKVLTHDGSLSTVSAAGKVTAAEVLGDAQIDETAKTLAPAADPAADKAVTAQVRPDRMLKLTAAGPGKVAVAYWGGTLRIVDDAGAIKSEQKLPQDVTALGWINGQLAAGLADGRLLLLTVK